jgi:hypothetical protein
MTCVHWAFLRRGYPIYGLVVLVGLAPAEDRGLVLLQRLQMAVGGIQKISAIRDYEEAVVAETFAASGEPRGTVRKRVRWIAPNFLRIDQTGPGSTYVLFFDGTSGWEILPDRASRDRTQGGPIDLVGAELKFAREYASSMIFKVWLADRMPGYSVSSPEENVIRVLYDTGQGVDITLDSRTWLPVKESATPRQSNVPAPQEMHYERWSIAAGIRFPARRVNFHNRIRLAILNTVAVKVNRDQRVEVLKAKPADSQPDLGK